MNKQKTLDIINDNEHWSLYPLLGVQRKRSFLALTEGQPQRTNGDDDIVKGVIIAGAATVYEKDIHSMDHQEPDHGLAAGCKLFQQLDGVTKHLYPSNDAIVEAGWEISLT